MPRYVDPRTGERFDTVPAEDEERARREFGLVPAEEYERDQALEARPLGEKIADKATSLGQGIARGAMAPGMALQQAITGEMPGVEAGREQSALSESVFGPEAKERRARNPITAGIGESVPSMIAGGITAGAGAGIVATAGILTAESAVGGLSQEAVDSVTEGRDFSAKAAGWNGVLQLGLGALVHGAARGIGALRGAADETAEAATGLRRNFLAEVDKGPVPTGEARAARSAGAAAEDFSDDVWDDAVKSIDDANAGAGAVPEARFVAEQAEPMLDLAAMQASDNLDAARRIMQSDISEAVRVSDVARAAEQWSPDMVRAQDEWVFPSVVEQGQQLNKVLAEAREGIASGKGFDPGGFGKQARDVIDRGIAAVSNSAGPERFNAINNLKRGVDGIIRDVGNSRRMVESGDAAPLIAALRPYTDGLREGLEQEALWGLAAPLQRDMNAAYHAVIEPLGRFESRLSERLGSKWGEVGQAAKQRRTKAGAMKQLIGGDAVTNRELLADAAEALDGIGRLAEARAQHGLSKLEGLPALEKALREVKADINMGSVIAVATRKAAEDAGGIGGAVAGAAIDAVVGRIPGAGILGGGAKNLAQRLLKAAKRPDASTPIGRVLENRLAAWSRNPDLANAGFSRRLPQWLQSSLRGKGGVVAGGAVGLGSLAALEGEAGAAQADPAKQANRQALVAQLVAQDPAQLEASARTVEGFGRVALQARTRVNKAVEDLFSAATSPNYEPRRSAEAMRLEARAEKLGVTRNVARFIGNSGDLATAYRQKSEALRRVAMQPGALVQEMQRNLGDIPTEHPEIFGRMVAETMRAAQYLIATKPSNSGRSVLNPEGFDPTDDEIEEWAGRWSGALSPLDTIEDLAANDVSGEQLETTKLLHPDAFSMFQQAAVSHIALLSQQRRQVPQHALEQLDSALDLQGAADPTLSWAMASLIEQATAVSSPQPGPEATMPHNSQSRFGESLQSSSVASMGGGNQK